MIELFEVTITICTAWIAVSAIVRWRRRWSELVLRWRGRRAGCPRRGRVPWSWRLAPV